MLRVNFYIDGFNLYYGCLRHTAFKWLDLEALAKQYIQSGDVLHRIRYFTARVTPRPNDPQAPQRQQIYLRALHTIPCLSVHLGRFQDSEVEMRLVYPPKTGSKRALVVKTEEKGSDVNLATYLLLDAFKNDAEVAIVVSNDSDLVEPIRIAKDELGMRVGILNPHPAKFRSLDLQRIPPTFFKQIRSGALSASQFPDSFADARGTLTRPGSWAAKPQKR